MNDKVEVVLDSDQEAAHILHGRYCEDNDTDCDWHHEEVRAKEKNENPFFGEDYPIHKGWLKDWFELKEQLEEVL